jgi:flagellar biosynthesis protein FliR
MDVTVPAAELMALLLASVRAAAWLVLAPPFSSRAVPATVKALLSVGIALPVVPRLADDVVITGAGDLVTALTVQVLAGAGLGFACQVLFTAVQSAGDLLDVAGGFSLGVVYDPGTGVGSAVMGRLFQVTALTLLFVTNGHLVVLKGFLRTYDLLPLDGDVDVSALTSALGSTLVTAAGQFMLAVVQIAGPMLGALFLADVGLGLLTRIAPALNPFSISFPLKILLVLMLVGSGVSVLPEVVRALAPLMAAAVTGTADAGAPGDG